MTASYVAKYSGKDILSSRGGGKGYNDFWKKKWCIVMLWSNKKKVDLSPPL